MASAMEVMNHALGLRPSNLQLSCSLSNNWRLRWNSVGSHRTGTRRKVSDGAIRALRTGPDVGAKKSKHSRTLHIVGDGQGEWSSEPVIQDMRDIPEPKWQEYPTSSRLIFVTLLYGGLYLAGQVLSNMESIHPWSTFELSPEACLQGLLFSLPPILASEIMHQEFVVKHFQPAQAICDAEEEETVDFFRGMTLFQMLFVSVMGGAVEEFFFRGALQSGISRWLQTGSRSLVDVSTGIPALTGMLPPFGPFSPALAAVVTSCIAGSIFFYLATPKDPKIVVAAAVTNDYKDRETVKKLVGGWVERRKMRRIYTPLIEGLVTFYLGMEWLQTGNLLAPIVTHALYDMWGAGSSLLRSPSRSTFSGSAKKLPSVAVEKESLKEGAAPHS